MPASPRRAKRATVPSNKASLLGSGHSSGPHTTPATPILQCNRYQHQSKRWNQAIQPRLCLPLPVPPGAPRPDSETAVQHDMATGTHKHKREEYGGDCVLACSSQRRRKSHASSAAYRDVTAQPTEGGYRQRREPRRSPRLISGVCPLLHQAGGTTQRGRAKHLRMAPRESRYRTTLGRNP